MNPLAAIFRAGVALRNTLYDRHIFLVNKLRRPVVSIGNISVGGSGKTPFVICLGELLKKRGIAFDVLSRGYGRSSTGTQEVNPQGTAEEFGDEPLLIARKLEVPVIVGADRYKAGLLAETKFASKLHLLDDGFQHRKLHRDFDIVMLPADDARGVLLPMGRLREPLSSLRRADAVVLPDADRMTSQHNVERSWIVSRIVQIPDIQGKAVAFCGIARPEQFFAALAPCEKEIAAKVTFRDHHRYTQSAINRLLHARTETGANGFITTEKDAINLRAFQHQLQPLWIVELRMQMDSPDRALIDLVTTVEQRTGCRL